MDKFVTTRTNGFHGFPDVALYHVSIELIDKLGDGLSENEKREIVCEKQFFLAG
jgi:hypothetical protein